MEPKRTLTIKYSGDHSGPMDDVLIKNADELGYELISTGYDLRFKERSLNFEFRE